MKKENKGITLIALVVTIIVLLILAGISISMLTGQNGILNRAGEAKTKTEEVQTEEELQMAITSLATEYYAGGGTGSFRDYIFSHEADLKAELGSEDISLDAEANTITYKGTVFEIDEDGNLTKLDEISLSESAKTLSIIDGTGEEATLTATLSGISGTITWTNSNSTAVTMTENGNTVTIVALAKGTATITASCAGKTASCEITVKEVIGDYVQYDVTYTDMYTGYGFINTNGWRILSCKVNEDDTTKYNVKLISTGIPAKLYYAYSSNMGKENNGWWGDPDQVRTLYGDTYAVGYDYNNGGWPNYFAATGMRLNFKEIVFDAGASTNRNRGVYNKINEKTTGELTGSEFIADEYENIEVHNLTLEELNDARGEGKEGTSHVSTDTGDTGLFYLRGLEKFGYTSSTESWYWLAYPCTTREGYEEYQCVYCVGVEGYIYGNDYNEDGVRPVVSITGVKMEKDVNGIWKMSN